MQLIRTSYGVYTNRRKSQSEWRYRFVMDDFGNAVMLERNIQNYFYSVTSRLV